MKIDKCSDQAVYITMDGWIFYIDNSTNEQIVKKWKVSDDSVIDVKNVFECKWMPQSKN
jgi:hypothetical protein